MCAPAQNFCVMTREINDSSDGIIDINPCDPAGKSVRRDSTDPANGLRSGVHSWSNVARRRRPEIAKSLVITKTKAVGAIGGNHQDMNFSGTSCLGPSQEPDDRSEEHLGHAQVGSLPV